MEKKIILLILFLFLILFTSCNIHTKEELTDKTITPLDEDLNELEDLSDDLEYTELDALEEDLNTVEQI